MWPIERISLNTKTAITTLLVVSAVAHSTHAEVSEWKRDYEVRSGNLLLGGAVMEMSSAEGKDRISFRSDLSYDGAFLAGAELAEFNSIFKGTMLTKSWIKRWDKGIAKLLIERDLSTLPSGRLKIKHTNHHDPSLDFIETVSPKYPVLDYPTGVIYFLTNNTPSETTEILLLYDNESKYLILRKNEPEDNDGQLVWSLEHNGKNLAVFRYDPKSKAVVEITQGRNRVLLKPQVPDSN